MSTKETTSFRTTSPKNDYRLRLQLICAPTKWRKMFIRKNSSLYISHTQKWESKLSVIVICNRVSQVHPPHLAGTPSASRRYTLHVSQVHPLQHENKEILFHTYPATYKEKKPEEASKCICHKGMHYLCVRKQSKNGDLWLIVTNSLKTQPLLSQRRWQRRKCEKAKYFISYTYSAI